MAKNASSHMMAVLICWCMSANLVLAGTVDLDEPGDHFAISPQTGALCVIAAARNEASVYPIASSKALPDGRIDRPVGKQPADVMYKEYAGKSYFIVACNGDKTIWVLDAPTLNVVKTITTAHAPMSLGAALGGKSPFVFYGSMEGLNCVDLRTFKDCPDLMANSPGQGAFHELCVSSDGHLVFGRAITWTPGGRLICSINYDKEGPPVAKSVGYQHLSVLSYHADPFSSTVAYDDGFRGNNGRGADPYRSMEDLPTPVSCFMTTRPLVISLDQNTLRFYSYNTRKELASTPVGTINNGNVRQNPQARVRRIPGQQNSTKVFVDEKNGNVLLCSASTVQVVELSSLDLPNEPLLGLSVDGTTVLNPGSTANLSLRKLSPTESVELKDPKSGMKLAGTNFTWTPGNADVGETKVTFRIFSGEFQRLQTIALQVRRPEIDLPFVPVESVMTDDGKLALLLGQSQGEPGRRMRQPGMQQGNPGSDLLLVDLINRSIIAKRTLPKSIHAIEIDANHAYAAATDSDAVYMYSLKDLSDERKIFASAPPQRIVTAGGKLYVASQQGTSESFSVPDLKPLDPKPQNDQMRGYNPFNQPALPIREDNGWLLDGVVYDSDLSHIVQLRSPVGFADVNPANFNPQQFNNGQAWASGWGLAVQNDRLMRMPSQNLGQIQGTNAAFLRDVPAVATLLVENQQDPNDPQQPRITTSVLFFDLIAASKQATVVLSDETRQPNQQFYGGYPGQPGQAILCAPGRLAVVAQDKLYVLDTSSLQKTLFPSPPKVMCEPGVKIINATGPTVIGFTASNLKAPVEFALDPDVKGIEIDKSSGKLTVDGSALISKGVEQLSQNIGQQMMYFQPGIGQPVQRTAQQALDASAEAPSAKYLALTGKKPDGIPMLVRVKVVALDADQQKVNCEVAGLICIPSQKVLDLVTARQAEQAANQKRMQEQQEQMFGNRRAMTTQPANAALQKQLDDLKAQVADLQKQNTELAAQNKMLKEMVMEQKKAP
jgi:hypothetical protein